MARPTTMRITASMHQLLLDLGAELRLPTSGVLYRAVGLLKYLADAERRGAHVIIHDPSTGADERLVFGAAEVPPGAAPSPVGRLERLEEARMEALTLADDAEFRSAVDDAERRRQLQRAERYAIAREETRLRARGPAGSGASAAVDLSAPRGASSPEDTP